MMNSDGELMKVEEDGGMSHEMLEPIEMLEVNDLMLDLQMQPKQTYAVSSHSSQELPENVQGPSHRSRTSSSGSYEDNQPVRMALLMKADEAQDLTEAKDDDSNSHPSRSDTSSMCSSYRGVTASQGVNSNTQETSSSVVRSKNVSVADRKKSILDAVCESMHSNDEESSNVPISTESHE